MTDPITLKEAEIASIEAPFKARDAELRRERDRIEAEIAENLLAWNKAAAPFDAELEVLFKEEMQANADADNGRPALVLVGTSNSREAC
jgi:hypothetical protein